MPAMTFRRGNIFFPAAFALMISFVALAEEVIPPASGQLVMVIAESDNSQTGRLFAFARNRTHWDKVSGPVDVTLGRAGLAWGIGLHPAQPGTQKREGDGKAPAGVFFLGDAFGAELTLATGLNYQPMSKDHYCVDVPASPLYNQTLIRTDSNARMVKGSTEPMRRDLHLKDHQYHKGIFVAHNPLNQPGAGSCIFMHIWRAPDKPTAGCTAMQESSIDSLLAWLDSAHQPILVQLTLADYQRLRQDWHLPQIK